MSGSIKRFVGCRLEFQSKTLLSLDEVKYITHLVTSYLRHIEQPDDVAVIPLEMKKVEKDDKKCATHGKEHFWLPGFEVIPGKPTRRWEGCSCGATKNERLEPRDV